MRRGPGLNARVSSFRSSTATSFLVSARTSEVAKTLVPTADRISCLGRPFIQSSRNECGQTLFVVITRPLCFRPFKEVEVLVRAVGQFPATEIGTSLISEAFKVAVGPLTDKSLPKAEQLAMLNLFLGALGLFKNPSSHRHVALTEAGEAAEMIVFASLLMRTVDARATVLRATTP